MHWSRQRKIQQKQADEEIKWCNKRKEILKAELNDRTNQLLNDMLNAWGSILIPNKRGSISARSCVKTQGWSAPRVFIGSILSWFSPSMRKTFCYVHYIIKVCSSVRKLDFTVEATVAKDRQRWEREMTKFEDENILSRYESVLIIHFTSSNFF